MENLLFFAALWLFLKLTDNPQPQYNGYLTRDY